MARAAGLTEIEARRVALEVVLTMASKISWKDTPDEAKIQRCMEEVTLRRIAAIRENRPESVADSPPVKKWWQFWKWTPLTPPTV